MLQLLSVANKISMTAGRDGSGEEPSLLEPLSPRSIVLSVLLGTHPPRMPVGRILDFTSLFDLPDGTVRTALSRMVAAGDLVNDDGVYQLAGRLVERQAQQDAGRREPPSDWDRTWWTVAVASDRRTMSERREFRTRAVGARLGEVRPDLWLRPANIDIPTDLAGTLITRGPMIAGDEHELVGRLWALDQLRHRGARHLAALDRTAQRLDRVDDGALAEAFVTLAAAQQFLRIEPQLPLDLAPDASAAAVRARYAEVVTAFQDELAAFFGRRRPDRVRTDGR
jgi:phenylacetic acid degradation operon negative regulatory protein